MWPHADLDNYWNGYRWRHRTDARGFRNPPGAATDVLVLGDSLVYGHGVEEEQTFVAALRRGGIGAYNLARQGDCLYDEYVLARLHVSALRPRAVVLVTFLNDFADLEEYRTTAQIEAPPELAGYDYAAIARSRDELLARRPSRLAAALASAPSVRLLGGLARSLRDAEWMTRAHAAGTPAALAGDPLTAPFLDPIRLARLERYHQLVLADLARRLRADAVGLVLAPLPAGPDPASHAPAQERLGALLRRLAELQQLTLVDLAPPLAGCAACFLPGDGHLSPAGHARVARRLAAALAPLAARGAGFAADRSTAPST
jgi:hypothetical protein